ncbi:hypothetical protein FA13DRAFT_1734441, partial [Coprinellus micaceus]
SLFGRTIPQCCCGLLWALKQCVIALFVYYLPKSLVLAIVLIISSVFSAALIFAMFGATSVAGVAAFAVFYGFFSGGAVSLTAPAVGSFITTSDLSDLG